MKKIINGKKYDTETAKEIAVFVGGNFDSVRITLFEKKTGEFFEYHETNESFYKSWIVPVSESEAKEFAEENLDADEYEAIFGNVQE